MRGMGKRLKTRARLLNLTDADVARSIGISQPRYANYANDTNEPDLDTFIRICKALDTTPDEMLGLKEIPPSSQFDSLNAQARAATASMGLSRLRIAVALLHTLAKLVDDESHDGDVNVRPDDVAS